ncbi:IS4 family transposase [Calothrix sp. HK-06]|nr:IS4 family transposase [Calothrix sp. HK-06]
MSNLKDIEVQNLDHLGIVAGIIDSIGLVEIINDLLGTDVSEKISSGHVVKAMILNGLGFVSSPLYMFSKFFESLPCEHLIGEGIKAEYLNDDKLGRTLDKLFEKGLTTTFLAIALNAVEKFSILLSYLHLDSTSFHTHGEYNFDSLNINSSHQNKGSYNESKDELEIESPQPINITYGYSRDHRPDLKQFIVDLICSGDGDIPIFFKSASGNETDSSSFGKILANFKKQIQVDSLMIADSALYTASNIGLLTNIQWLCRVPFSISLAKKSASELTSSELIKSQVSGYSFAMTTSNYGGIEQRWLVVESSSRKDSDLRKLEKKIQKLEQNAILQLKKLQKEQFNCYQDARLATSKLSKQFKYHQIDNIEIIEKASNTKISGQTSFYQLQATLSKDESAIASEIQSAGRFVLATNVLDETLLSNDSMISEYKAQQSCERGFGFLKDPLFFTDSVFLKTPKRIEALAFIMALCLLVYTLAQRQIRLALMNVKSTIKNQLGKPTNRPTMRWIFQCFQSIHILAFNNEKQISNLTPDRQFILSFLPEDCRRYYNC